MENEVISVEKSRRFHVGKRFLALLLVLVSLVQLLPMTAWAAWDGSGSTGGTSQDLVDSNVWLVMCSQECTFTNTRNHPCFDVRNICKNIYGYVRKYVDFCEQIWYNMNR